MLFHDLNEGNFDLFAAKAYDNPQCCDIEEYHSDVLRFRYIKRLLKRYLRNGDLQDRLIINHLIILFNVFGNATVRMLFAKLEPELYPLIKPFLVYMNRLPVVIESVNGFPVVTNAIMMDDNIVRLLQEFVKRENA